MKINIPTYEEVVEQIKPVLRVINEALEFAAAKTRDFFVRENLKNEDGETQIDPSLGPDLVRFWAKWYLQHHGYSVLEEETAYTINNIPHNGLYVIFEKFHIRIWKSINGRPPAPGHSIAKQAFFHQATFYFPSQDTAAATSEPIALIVLWNANSDYTNLEDLVLACPKSGDVSQSSVELHWIEKVQHPVLTLEPAKPETAREEEERDLPIRFQETGTEDEG